MSERRYLAVAGRLRKGELEQRCAEIRGLRPPVLRDATRRQLDRLRGFRHVVRNVYAMHMEADQMRDLVADLPAASRAVSEDLLAFAAWLESVALAEPDEDTPRG